MGRRNPCTSKLPSVYVAEELHRQIRLIAAEDRRSIQDVAEELLRGSLTARRSNSMSSNAVEDNRS